jgi:hypothetical protein
MVMIRRMWIRGHGEPLSLTAWVTITMAVTWSNTLRAAHIDENGESCLVANMHANVFISHETCGTTWPRSITVYEISFDGTTLLRLRMVGDP